METVAQLIKDHGPLAVALVFLLRSLPKMIRTLERICYVVTETAKAQKVELLPEEQTPRRPGGLLTALSMLACLGLLTSCAAVGGVGRACNKVGKSAVCGAVGLVNDLGKVICGDDAAPAPEPMPMPEPPPPPPPPPSDAPAPAPAPKPTASSCGTEGCNVNVCSGRGCQLERVQIGRAAPPRPR